MPVPGLSAIFKGFALEEMEDADRYIHRILFLDGHPNLQRLGTVQVGEDPLEQLDAAERVGVENWLPQFTVGNTADG